MSEELTGSTVRTGRLAETAMSTAQRWGAAGAARAGARSRAVARLVADDTGLGFVLGLIDRVVRPRDRRVAARALEGLSRQAPRSFPLPLRLAIALAGGFAPVVPTFLVPLVRRTLLRAVGNPVMDVESRDLGTRVTALSRKGARVDVALLGRPTPDHVTADRFLASARRLRARNDVVGLSFPVTAVSGPFSLWSFDEAVHRISERLVPLYTEAAEDPTATVITLEVTRHHDLDLTIAVLTRILETPGLERLEAGITLPAQVPDAFEALQELTAWARTRRSGGGAPIRIRIDSGTPTGLDTAMERVEAERGGWPGAPPATDVADLDTDVRFVRMLDWVLTSDRTDAVRVGIADRDLVGAAFATELAKERGVDSRVDLEVPAGLSGLQLQAVLADAPAVVIRLPAVLSDDPVSFTSGVIRHLEQQAHLGWQQTDSGKEPARSSDCRIVRFCAVIDGVDPDRSHGSLGRPDRSKTLALPPLPEPGEFRNAPATDAAIAANREWGRRILRRVPASDLGGSLLETAALSDAGEVDSLIESVRESGAEWGRRRAATRAQVLQAAGDALETARGALIEVMASEIGSTIDEGDSEVTSAVDLARYYADQAPALESLEYADVASPDLILVVSDRSSPAASLAHGVFSALAAGAAVIVAPGRHQARTAAVMVQALWDGGVPRAVLALADIADLGLRRAIVAHPGIDRVILEGDRETAALVRSWRADLPLLAASGGTNAVVLMPSADPDAAIADIITGAFGRAGQAPWSTSLVILVGSIGRSKRFRRRLVDAVTVIRVGMPDDPATRLGPLVDEARGADLLALTELGSHERWLVRPEKDRSTASAGRLWSPGIRDRVRPGSDFHLGAHHVPVIGIMYAETLEEALALQNAPSSVSTAAIYSLEPDELAEWVERVDAGTLFVNHAAVGAEAGRRPLGIGKRATVGPAAAVGGRDLLVAIGDVDPLFDDPAGTVALTGVSEGVRRLIEAAQPSMTFLEFDRVRTAVVSDQREWSFRFGVAEDVANLSTERNLVRYRPATVTIRVAEGATNAQLVRVLAAATRARAAVAISSAEELPAGMARLLASLVSPVRVTRIGVESDSGFLQRLQVSDARPERIRLIGGSAADLMQAIDGDIDVAVYAAPVTTEGRIELLPFLKEQTITITTHRFGRADRFSAFRLPEERAADHPEEWPRETVGGTTR